MTPKRECVFTLHTHKQLIINDKNLKVKVKHVTLKIETHGPLSNSNVICQINLATPIWEELTKKNTCKQKHMSDV